MNILRRNCDKLKFYSARFSKMSGQGPIESKIQNCLTKSLLPSHLEILNESYMHNVPKGSETHFKILVVSEKFEGISLINRHRMVYKLLEEEDGLKLPHALSIVAKIPKEYSTEYKIESSPACKGGFGK